MTRRAGLGRGLEALIPGGESPPLFGSNDISVDQIIPNPRQPRKDFDSAELAELASSIREHGVLQPIIVTYDASAGKYVLVAGERRWLAARLAGLNAVPAVIRDASEQQRLELALIENVQRADLNPIEAAAAYQQLSEEFALSHEEIANRVGKNRVTITNTLRLLNLPQVIQQALVDHKISEGHARALLGLPSPQAQASILQAIVLKGLNVRQTEELVRKLAGQRSMQPLKPPPEPEISALEERLRSYLGTKVRVNRRAKGGSLVIHFYSDEELNALIDLILGQTQ